MIPRSRKATKGIMKEGGMNKMLLAAISLAFATSAMANLTADEEAYVKAALNGARAECLSMAVDRKIAYDVAANTIRDVGNVVTAPICEDYVYADFMVRRAELTKDPEFKKDWEKSVREYIKKKGWK